MNYLYFLIFSSSQFFRKTFRIASYVCISSNEYVLLAEFFYGILLLKVIERKDFKVNMPV